MDESAWSNELNLATEAVAFRGLNECKRPPLPKPQRINEAHYGVKFVMMLLISELSGCICPTLITVLFKASIKMSGVFFSLFFLRKDEKAGGMCLMKSRAYRPSHDRIIIPNASSKHFKGHFIPVPTPHNTSQQSRWPDLNQVPLAGPWCPTPSDQQDICRANSIRFTLVSQKCMDLSLSDAFVCHRAREDATCWYWREQTAQREHAGRVHAQKHASSCHLVSLP